MFGGDALLIQCVEAVDFVFFVADFQGGAGVETVERHDGLSDEILVVLRWIA
jgi:hypothetical protein